MTCNGINLRYIWSDLNACAHQSYITPQLRSCEHPQNEPIAKYQPAGAIDGGTRYIAGIFWQILEGLAFYAEKGVSYVVWIRRKNGALKSSKISPMAQLASYILNSHAFSRL